MTEWTDKDGRCLAQIYEAERNGEKPKPDTTKRWKIIHALGPIVAQLIGWGYQQSNVAQYHVGPFDDERVAK